MTSLPIAVHALVQPGRSARPGATGRQRRCTAALRPVALAFAVAASLCPALAAAQAAGADAARGPARIAPLPATGTAPPAPWRVVGLPDGNRGKPYTAFALASVDGRRALRVEADLSYGNLVYPLRAEPGNYQALAWRWQVEKLNEAADLRQKSGDDTTVKVCAMFDLPLDRLPFAERQMMRVARSLADGPVPAATICYVWDARLAAGTELPSPFTARVRYIVLESGSAKVGQWVAERRDLAADFQRLFGAESGGEPRPLIGVGVGADADNTRQRSVAYVADLSLEP